MKRLAFVAACALLLYGCPKKHQPKPPEPPKPPVVDHTQPPTELVFPDLLLRNVGGRFNREIRGAIPCWPNDLPDGTPGPLHADGRVIPYMWTLTSKEWIDHAKAKGGANAFHVRLGPYRQDKLCCGLENVGGPLNADGSFNPRFDAYLVSLLWYAGEQGVLVEVDLDDGWGRKHQMNGDDVGYALPLGAVIPGPREAFLRHYIEITRNFGNVVYQLGNENDLAPDWTPGYERALYALVRSMTPHQMIGSNTRDEDGPYDYMASHKRNAVDSPTNGKPVWVNEYNPAMSVGEFAECFSEMRAKGSACWYWRSDGDDATQEASLAVMKGGPVTDYACPDPKPDPAKLDWWIDCSRMRSCDATPFQRGDHDYCVAIGMADMGGQPRFNCPMRNEGDPFRVACEQYAMKRAAPKWRSDGDVSLVDGAGFRARTTGTWLQACDESEEHCSARVPAP